MDKKPDRPPLRIIVKYFLLQLPGMVTFALLLFLFHRWTEVPAYLLWVLLGIWVAKDILLFPFLWRFYDPDNYPDRFRMTGRRGIALTRLDPDGYVRVRGERWHAAVAEGEAVVEKGDAICVEAVNGLRLTVRAC
jgi:membrane protein implicated in regulation of membrane protease activity